MANESSKSDETSEGGLPPFPAATDRSELINTDTLLLKSQPCQQLFLETQTQAGVNGRRRTLLGWGFPSSGAKPNTNEAIQSSPKNSITESEDKAESLSGKKMPFLPSEVWATIFSYVSQNAVPLNAPQISEFRLLSRSIRDGLDEWLLQAMGNGLKKDKCLRLIPAASNGTPLPIQVQKRALLALSRAPEELLCAILKVEGAFLAGPEQFNWSQPRQQLPSARVGIDALERLLSQLLHVTSIRGPFLNWLDWLQIVDLRHMKKLTKIGTDFLRRSTVQEILLPPCLKRVEGNFLEGSTVAKLDLARSGLTHVGMNFLSGATVDEVTLPPSLKVVGYGFLLRAKLNRVDLSRTAMMSAGGHFLTGTTIVDELILPKTLKLAGDCFLTYIKTKRVDLSQTMLQTVGEYCLGGATVDELILPSNFKHIDHYFAMNAKMKRLDLSHTVIETIGDSFLSGATIDELILPNTLRFVGFQFLTGVKAKRVDLSQTRLIRIELTFMSESTIEELILPTPFRDMWLATPTRCHFESIVFVRPERCQQETTRKRRRQESDE